METIIKQTLTLLLNAYGADYDVVGVSEKNGHYTANIESAFPGKLIGRGAMVLSSLQVLLKAMLWSKAGEKVFVTVDVDGYRAAQHQKTYDKVAAKIEEMKEENLPEMKLRPMRPGQRRIVHLWIAENYPELASEGVGEGAGRSVKIFYK